MDVRGLGYIGLGVGDIDAWRQYGALLGVMVDDDGPGIRWRIDERQCRVLIAPGRDDLEFAGWELPDAAALEQAVDELEAAGCAVTPGSSDDCARRAVRELVRTQDPAGATVELFHGPILDHVPFVSPQGVSGFTTEHLGFGHVVVGTPALEECVAYYTDVLGFRVSDLWRAGGRDVTFLHCNQRHHSIALVPADALGFYHFMLEARTLDDVGATFDRLLDADAPISAGIGKHTNDHMVSFYSRSPSGFEVEFGCGGRLVDDATWTVTEITKPSFWGHRPPAG